MLCDSLISKIIGQHTFAIALAGYQAGLLARINYGVYVLAVRDDALTKKQAQTLQDFDKYLACGYENFAHVLGQTSD